MNNIKCEYHDESKPCHACKEVKPLTDFHKKAASKDGHNPTCKVCVTLRSIPYDKKRQKEKRDANAIKMARKRANRLHHENNKERINREKREKYDAARKKNGLESKEMAIARVFNEWVKKMHEVKYPPVDMDYA